MDTKKHLSPNEPRAGWKIPDWCHATSISRAAFYLLAQKPGIVKLGRRTVVIESPEDYLQRLAALGKEKANSGERVSANGVGNARP